VASVLVVELKSLPALLPAHTSQVISYLKTMGLSLGLLFNFGERHPKTGNRRVVLSR
jgi:GxxExxY protein